MEEIRNIITVIATLISFWSVYTARRLWYQSNRPLLSALLKEHSAGIDTALFDLIIVNSGNRPATDIYIKAKKVDIDSVFKENAKEGSKKYLYQIFSGKSKIQVLLNGKEVKTAFSGCSTNIENSACILEYESELPIIIHYKDIDGNKYYSKLSLYIRDSDGFGGSVWKKEPSK